MSVAPYQIQTGDNLSVIAADRGMSLEELVAANPVLPIENWWRRPIRWNEAGAVVWLNDPWIDFTPDWLGLNIGNATQKAGYRYGLGMLHAMGVVTYGSTTAISGNIRFLLPDSVVMDITKTAVNMPLGLFVAHDVSAGKEYTGAAHRHTSTRVSLRMWSASGAHVEDTNVTTTVPFTWATGDELQWNISVPLT